MVKKALIFYWSKTGNTEKVANAIKQGLEAAKVQVTIKNAAEAGDVDYFDYDLVSVGAPAYSWHPPEPTDNLKKSLLLAAKRAKLSHVPQKFQVKTR